MCITSEILNGIAKAVEGFLDIGAPVFLIKLILEIIPDAGIAEVLAGSGKQQLSLLV